MKKTTKTILTMILFLCLGGLFGYTVTSSIKSTDRSKQITQVLEDNCDCKEINQIIYAKGIQFGSNGLSTEKGEYQLVDCNFLSIKEEAERIHKLLSKEIRKFDKVDLLELEFLNGNNSEIIIIKNGKIK